VGRILTTMWQTGSHFIQQRLVACIPLEQQLAAQEVVSAIELLHNDVFCNYVVQKLLEHGTTETKRAICARYIAGQNEGNVVAASFKKALESLAQQ
jgi:Pumilio-family RNA binding repeat